MAGFGLVLLCGVWFELGNLEAMGLVGRDGGGRRGRHGAAGAAHLGFPRRAARSRWRRAARRGRCMWGAVAQIFLSALAARPPASAGSSITTGRWPASSGRVLLAGCPAPVGWRFRRAGRPARSLHARRDRGFFPPAPVAWPPAPAGSLITTGCWPASSGRVLLAGCSAPGGSRFRRAGRPARSLHARRDRGVFPPAPVARPPAPAGSFITTGRSPASSGRGRCTHGAIAAFSRRRRWPGCPRRRARSSRPAVRPRAAGACFWLAVPRRAARVFAERAGRRGRCTRAAIAAFSRRRRWLGRPRQRARSSRPVVGPRAAGACSWLAVPPGWLAFS